MICRVEEASPNSTNYNKYLHGVLIRCQALCWAFHVHLFNCYYNSMKQILFILILNMRQLNRGRLLICSGSLIVSNEADWNPRGLRPESVLLIIVLYGKIQLLLYPSLGVEMKISVTTEMTNHSMYLYGVLESFMRSQNCEWQIHGLSRPTI